MATPKRIGIVGAGNIGTALTRRLTATGHDVAVANSRDPETLVDLARETGARVVRASEVARDAELVVITVPQRAVPELPAGLLDAVAPGAVVVDTGNYAPQQRDGRIDDIEEGVTESRWVSRQLGRPVVKAFGTIQSAHLEHNGTPGNTPGRIALPVAGDDPVAKAVVMELIDEIGFDTVDAGGLDESWRLQPGSPVFGTDLDADGVRAGLAAASPDRAPEWSAGGAPGLG